MLHLREYGDPAGRPVLALHGVGGNGMRWADLAGRLTGIRLLCPDLRGHGRSVTLPPWDLDRHAEDVVATLDAALPGGEPVDVLGFSFGGAIAVHVAALHADRVRGLGLLDPAIGLAPEFVAPKAARLLDAESYADPGEAVEAMTRPWTLFTPEQAKAEVAEFLTEDPDGRWRWRTGPLAQIVAFSEMCRRPSAPAHPALLIRTAQNPGGSAWFAAACAHAPHVETVTLDCGHRMLQELPEQTAALVARFLTR
ncbi:MAG: alpha/beta hydrolase [Hamadaea sp.]|nr:alpha/beta hydrolase [Hamadaea sp.]